MSKLWKIGYGVGVAAFLIIGCLANPAVSETIQHAVVSTVAADYSSGAHSVIKVDPVKGPRKAVNQLLPTISDISVAAYGRYFYRLERMSADNVMKFDIDAPGTPIWQFSTLDKKGESTSNPQTLIFVSETKAYLLRYEKTKAWIVNPSATEERQFKIGELDLSSYGDQDGIPEMHNGIIVGGKLFISLHRLDRNNEWIPNNAYIAVFDITTNTEITTGIPNADNVKGIPIPIKNPNAMSYLKETNSIYIQGVGKYGADWSGVPPEYSGGIIRMNPDTYEITTILDDGDDANHPYGQISGMAILSPTKGYFVGYAGWGDNTLYSFNPSTGQVGSSVQGLIGKNIAGMEGGAYADKNGMLWVCNQTDSRIDIINPVDNSIDESISTVLNPTNVVFVTVKIETTVTTTTIPADQTSDSGGSGGCFIASLHESHQPSWLILGLFGFMFAAIVAARKQ